MINQITGLKEAYENGISKELFFQVPGWEEPAIRQFKAQTRLIILGCGYVSQALCRIAAPLGFSVIAVDDRPSFANHLLFPDASQIICDSFPNALERLGVRESDYFAVVTRGHREDATCLRKILPLENPSPAYLGLIGSKRRVFQLFNMLEEEGLSRSRMDKIHSPIGLDIGAVTPDEIAVAIIAEMIKERRKNYVKERTVLEQTNVDPIFLEELDKKEEKVLAVVLSTMGSTPVKSGAIMAVNSYGLTFGTIGGGCGENEVRMHCMDVFRKKHDTFIQVDMSNDVAGDEGMVCGGHMEVGLYYISGEIPPASVGIDSGS